LIIPLSAKTDSSLNDYAKNLLSFINKNKVNLADVAYTFQVAREPMAKRLAIIASSIDSLKTALTLYINDNKYQADNKTTFKGSVSKEINPLLQDDDMSDAINAGIEKWLTKKKYDALTNHWVNGNDINWPKLYGKLLPQRIPCPSYPFAKENYWLEMDASQSINQSNELGFKQLHPLVHQNDSNMSELK
jgi:acyl transferase domain-containing protein